MPQFSSKETVSPTKNKDGLKNYNLNKNEVVDVKNLGSYHFDNVGLN